MAWSQIAWYTALILLATAVAAIQEAWTRAHPRAMRPDEIARMNALHALGATPTVANHLARGEKISAIKAYREQHGVGLKEAKDAVDSLERSLRQASL